MMRIEPGRAWTEQEVQEINRLWIESEGGCKSVVYRYHRVWFESAPKITVVVQGAYMVDVSFVEKGAPPETLN
jgi:hypothetical protein